MLVDTQQEIKAKDDLLYNSQGNVARFVLSKNLDNWD